jgi:hypothetical protein
MVAHCLQIHLVPGVMRKKVFISLLCCLLFAPVGCKKKTTDRHPPSSQAAASPASQESVRTKLDACSLITKEEIQAIQGSPIIDTKSSESSTGAFRISQCYFSTAEPSKSVSLAVTQSDGTGKRSPKDFWKETFGRYENEEKEREGDKEKRESLRDQRRGKEEQRESAPPKKIKGIGDDAYWAANRVGGALYVLKQEVFIRISVGGPDNEETKLEKSEALARKAIERL